MVARKKAVSKKPAKKKPAKKPVARTKKPAAKRAVAKARAKAPKKSALKKSAPKKPAPKKPAPKKSAPKKQAAKKQAAKKQAQPASPKAVPRPGAPVAPSEPIRREDWSGHLDPRYVAELRARSGAHQEEDRAFFGKPRSGDDLAEELGEEAVEAMTSGEDAAEDAQDQIVEEERGGPFVESSARTEYAYDTDASNPEDADREPFPTT